MRRAHRRLVFGVLALLALTGCGVPLDAAPEPVEIEPFEASVVEPTPVEGLEAVPMYLVEDGVLVPVTRDLPPPRTVSSVLSSLLDGTTTPEERTGLRTSIPGETELIDVEMEGSTARIDLSRGFAAVGGDEELLAVAQIVLTVTELEEVDSVLFELEGVPTDVPLPNGALTDRPVADEYRQLLSP